jgi:1-acyl-sn-glycerol-3-phosphate acyltransferase
LKKFFLTVLSAVLWVYFVVSSIVLTLIIIVLKAVTYPFDKNLRVVQKFSCFWGAQYIWVVPLWSARIYGRKKIDDRKVKIMVSNHQSFADILLMNSLFRHFRWTSKAENFKIPFVGWVLAINRSLRIYRNASDAWERFEKQAVKSLAEGNSLLIFPEGTRSRTGVMGKFKEGAFKLALETKTDLQPMVLDGSSKAVPQKGWVLTGRSKMVVRVLDIMPYESFKDLTASQLAQKVHGLISENLSEIRNQKN